MAGQSRALARVLGLVLIALCTGTVATASSRLVAVDDEMFEGRAPTAQELEPAVQAAFAKQSYFAGSTARLAFFDTHARVTLQLFRTGPEHIRTVGNDEFQGIAVSAPVELVRTRPGTSVDVRIGAWPSGLYYARLQAADGEVGFAPFVLRPRRLGANDVAVVMPTLTWQAYNLRDDNGDGRGDSWYADWNHHTVRLARPFLSRGVPYNFRRYDLPFLHWLAWTGKQVDVLSDSDLEQASAAELGRYRLIVFPGHHEYVTTHEYDVVDAYRDHGGHLMFLSANDFFWQVVRHGNVIERTKEWRDLGRPEAALIGVDYRGNDRGTHRAPWTIRDTEAAPWLFAGTNLQDGMPLGSGGIEIDETSDASPRNVHVLADIRDLFGAGFTAQMTYYTTPAGAEVFAAGAFTIAGSALQPTVSTMLENLWTHLAGSAS